MNRNRRLRKAAMAVTAAALTFTMAAGPVAGVLAAETDTQTQSTTTTTDSSSSSGQQPGGTPPEMPSGGSAPSGGAPSGEAPSGAPGGGGADTQSYDYSGTNSGVLSADGEEKTSDGETTSSTEADVNTALAQNGGTLTITDGTLEKSGDDTNGDNCNFYGLNSISLTVGEKSKTYISDSTLSADSEGSNAIFATDSGTVYAYNDTISTTAGNSRGLDATYSGTIIADSMKITTKGDHCAALATDRGGGNISVTNSTLSTAGSGSPLLYSTGDIEVDNVTGTATGSQIAGMEGLNTILIHNSELSSTITSKTASDPVANGVIIYQSTSGDAESTTGEAATFQAVDSTLKSAITEGSMFYVTNTTADILLSNTTLDFDSDKAALLTVEGNDANNWGTAGSNGGTVNFTAQDQTLEGDISVDTISALTLYLMDESTWTGSAQITTNSVNTSASDAPITVNIDSTSTWVVTDDTEVSALNVADGGKVVDEDGKSVTIVSDGETVVEGESDVTVTVDGSYSTTVNTDDAVALDTDYIDRSDFDDYYQTSTTFAQTTSNKSGSSDTAAAASTEETADTADSTEESEETSEKKSSTPVIPIAAGALVVGGGLYEVIRVKNRKKDDEEK